MATPPRTDTMTTRYTLSMWGHLCGWLTRAYTQRQEAWARMGAYERLARTDAARTAFGYAVGKLHATWWQRYDGGQWRMHVEVRRWVDYHGATHYRTVLAPRYTQRVVGGEEIHTDELPTLHRVTAGRSA